MITNLLFLLVFFIFGRVFPYLQSSVPLGYDPGLYLYVFKKYSQTPFFSYLSLPKWLIELFPPGIPILGKLCSYFISPEKILIPFIVFFSILLWIAVYLLTEKLWGKKVALWTILIFTGSAIQYRFYWYYYLKNIAALSFLLITVYFLLKSSYWAILFAVLVVYFHHLSFIFLLIIFLTDYLVNKKKRKFYKIVGVITCFAAAIYYLPTFERTVLPYLNLLLKSVIPQSLGGKIGTDSISGTFYSRSEALMLAMPYLPLAIFGFKKEGFKKKNLLISLPLLFCLLIIVSQIFSFRRMIVFLDLFLIIFSGVGLNEFLKIISKTKIKKIFLILYPLILLFFIAFFVYKTGKPLIYEDELREIIMLSKVEKNAYVLVTDRSYTPWIYGWSDRKPIAPGFGEHDVYWTNYNWRQFWEGTTLETRHNLLLKLPKPLYIFSGDRQPIFNFDFSGDCFRRVNWRTYKFICEK